jgi:hypothetical protein
MQVRRHLRSFDPVIGATFQTLRVELHGVGRAIVVRVVTIAGHKERYYKEKQ